MANRKKRQEGEDRIFKKLFREAEIAQYNEAERQQYELSLKEYWDYTSTMDTAYMKGEKKGLEKGREEGRAEGRQKEKAETVQRLRKMGLTLEQIAQGTDLSIEEVTSLLS